MKDLRYFVCFFFLLIFYDSKAADGCVIAGITHTRQTGVSNIFFENPNNPANTCWTGTYVGVCQVCIGGTLTVNLPPLASVCLKLTAPFGFSTGAQYSNYQVVQCNLDDYSWAFSMAAGVFGLIIIRRKKTR